MHCQVKDCSELSPLTPVSVTIRLMPNDATQPSAPSWLDMEITLCREHAALVDKREQYEQFIRVLAEQGLLPTDAL
jgi:hypothetical protein